MKVLDPGHYYSLNELDTYRLGGQQLRFVKRNDPPDKYPGNGNAYPGTTTQEVLRALIDRTKYVDNQMPARENVMVLALLREALLFLEMRAARVHGRTLKADSYEIENQPTCSKCGHLECEEHAIKS